MTESSPRGRKHAIGAALAVAIAALAIFVAGCGGGSSSSSTGGASTEDEGTAFASGGTLTTAVGADAEVTDPQIATEATTWQILSLVYESLVGVGENQKLIPALAESWEQPSPTEYVFDIRKDVKFSNGRPMTVDDVIGSLERVLDPKTASYWAGQLGPVKSITEDGAWKVKITLEEPHSSLLAALAHVSTAILPMKELEDGSYDPTKEQVGTGPFKVEAHLQGESWTFVKNPYYWKPGEPKVDKLVLRIMPEEAARVAGLRDGSVEVALFDNPDAIQLLEGEANIKTDVQEQTDYWRMDINGITSPVFKDPKLREALALTIDREEIRDLALNGLGEVTAASPANFEDSCDPSKVPNGEPDIEKARELVEEAGATGKTIRIITTREYPTAGRIAQVVQQNLEEAGLKVQLEQLEAGEWLRRLVEDESAPFDISIVYFAGYADPSMVLAWWNPEFAIFNQYWLEKKPELIELVNKSLGAPHDAKRQEVLQETCDAIAKDANIIPLVTKNLVIGSRSDKVNAPIPALEGYSIPLREIGKFTVAG
jgi:peptide/nickel transport system substrate-binding protein